MDDIDRASDLEAQFTEHSLAEHRHRVHRHAAVTVGGDCEDCGCAIPPERLAAIPDAVCCVGCQALRETRRVDQYR